MSKIDIYVRMNTRYIFNYGERNISNYITQSDYEYWFGRKICYNSHDNIWIVENAELTYNGNEWVK